jgi:hypothetical protein
MSTVRDSQTLRAQGRRVRPLAVVAMATLVLAVLNLAAALDPLSEGLRGTYHTDAKWRSAPARLTIDPAPSTYRLFLAWRGSPPAVFSATWTGYLIALREGDYTLATSSDDGSQIYVDERIVVDNSRGHAGQIARGSVHLTRGVHRILITYFQDGGPLELELLWARGDEPLRPMPSWAFASSPATFGRFFLSVLVRRSAEALVWPWLALVIAALTFAMSTTVRRAVIGRDYKAAIEWTMVFAGGFVLLFVMHHEIGSDGLVRYFALAQLIEWHELANNLYSLVGPLCSAPLYFLGRVVASSQWWCARFNTIVFLSALAVAWELVRKGISAALFRKLALVLIAASMFPYHLAGFFGEVFTTMLVGVGLLAVRFGRPAAGWSAAVLGVVNTPATLVGLGVAALVECYQTRRLRHLIPVVAAPCLIMIEAWIRRGSPFATGYEGAAGSRTILTYSGRPGFSYPLFFGLLSVLFSFGKGLVFYAPGLLLPIRARLRAVSRRLGSVYNLWVAFLIGLILIYSKWWAWFGGWTWGPRFFLIAAIPASCAIAVTLSAYDDLGRGLRFALFAILTLSAWVAIDGVVFHLYALNLCLDDTFASLCWYVPEFSPLWRPFVEFTPPTIDRAAVGLYFVAVYVWLVSPIAVDLWRGAVAIAADGWRAVAGGEPWRI